MVTGVLASIPKIVCELTSDKYETLLNFSRSTKSLTEFIIESRQWIAPIVNPIFAKLAELFSFKTFALSSAPLKILEPFSRAVKNGRDFLNFFELPLAVKKLIEGWSKASAVKRASMLITIPQKLLESCLLIPDNFNIFSLNEIGMKMGRWCAAEYGKSWTWELLNYEGIFCVKEVFALGASITNFAAYWGEYNDFQERLNRKMHRFTVDLSPLKNTIDAVVAREAPYDALKPLLERYNTQAEQRHSVQAANRQKPYQTLNHLEKTMNSLHTTNKHEEFEITSNRYIRRFFLEKDGQGLPLNIPGHLPPIVRQRLQSIMIAFPTPQERLKRILTYKFEKNRLDNEMSKLGLKKDTVGWWYEISKMTIITLGLLSTALAFAPLACTLATYVTLSTLCSAGTLINFGRWGATFFIGSMGLLRTLYMTYFIRPEEDKIKKIMPDPKLVFAL